MKNSFILLIVVVVFSCNTSEKEGQEKTTLEVLKQLSPATDFSGSLFILIIPFDGCTSCFDYAVSLIPSLDKETNLIIMPNIHKRVIINSMEDLGIDQNTIIMDTLQLTLKKKLVESNPRILLIDDNKITFSEIVDVTNIESIREIISEY